MNKSILVLDENSVVHGLIASALDIDGLTLHHEFNPHRFLARAQETQPDLILLSNTDSGSNYAVCRHLKREHTTAQVPLVLLANSGDAINTQTLSDLGVNGVIRKPFEASDLQQQVSKHLNLIDLVGAAYEYRKSQSLRDDDANPLAAIDVLDAEVLGILRPDASAPEPPDVPEVDFSDELNRENVPIEMDESELAAALHPEHVFENLPDLDAADEFPTEELELTGLSFAEEAALERLNAAGVLFGPAGDIEELTPADLLDEAPLEELGSSDVLDEERPGETSAPARFDRELDTDAPLEPEALELLEDQELLEREDAYAEAESTEEVIELDLLEEEEPGESTSPSAFDQALQGAADSESEELELDEIDVELSQADVEYDESLEESSAAAETEVTPFEEDLAAVETPPAPVRSRAYEDDIPPTVRRMMELRPVFTMTPEEKVRELDSEFPRPGDAHPAVREPTEEELDRMAEELGSIGDMELEFDMSQEPAQTGADEMPADLPEPDMPAVSLMDESAPEGEIEGVESDVDEARILEALEADAAAGLAEGEFAGELDDEDLIVDEDLEFEKFDAAAVPVQPAPLDEEITGADLDEAALEDIAIDLDEETLVMSSLDEEPLSEDAFGYEAPTGEALAAAEEDELPPLEDDLRAARMSGADAAGQPAEGLRLSISNIPEAEQLPTDEDVLPSLEEEQLELAELSPEEEAALEHDARILEKGKLAFEISDEEVLEVPPEGGLADADADMLLEDEHLLSLEAETMEELEDLEESLNGLAEETAGPAAPQPTPVAEAADWRVEDLEPTEEGAPDELDQEFLQDDLGPIEAEDQSAAAADAAGAGVSGLGDDFMDDLMALQEEFKSRPGERLSDILKAEGIEVAAAAIDFELPQHEQSFARVMGVEELPGAPETLAARGPAQGASGSPDDWALHFTNEVLGAAESGLAGAALRSLDAQLRERLGDILDEMITVTVRKAIQEEMPKLLQQMEKEHDRA